MDNYLQMFLNSINSVPGPGYVAPSPTLEHMPQTVDQAAQSKMLAAAPKPKQAAQAPQQAPQQTPGNPIGQQAMDPVSQGIMQTPNPNRPPMLPQGQIDAMGTPASPGNPGYIGPFREGEPQGANPMQAPPQGQQAPQAPAQAAPTQKPHISLKITPEVLRQLFEDHSDKKEAK